MSGQTEKYADSFVGEQGSPYHDRGILLSSALHKGPPFLRGLRPSSQSGFGFIMSRLFLIQKGPG